MTASFPAVTAKQVVKILEHVGFVFLRQSGSSHAIYKRVVDQRRTVIPMHGHTILKRRTLKSILKDANLTLEEFRRLLGEV